jgi:hypothetical protein
LRRDSVEDANELKDEGKSQMPRVEILLTGGELKICVFSSGTQGILMADGVDEGMAAEVVALTSLPG